SSAPAVRRGTPPCVRPEAGTGPAGCTTARRRSPTHWPPGTPGSACRPPERGRLPPRGGQLRGGRRPVAVQLLDEPQPAVGPGDLRLRAGDEPLVGKALEGHRAVAVRCGGDLQAAVQHGTGARVDLADLGFP